MNILVTGCLGTLGSPLCRELKARGFSVYGTDLRHDAGHGLDGYMRADVGEYDQLNDVFSEAQPDFVFHLAAEFGRNNGQDYNKQLWQSNAHGTHNVIRACEFYGSKMILASSSEIYGEGDFWDEPILDEQMSDRVPLRQHNDYAISKWVNELQVSNAMHNAPNFEAMTLRFFNAYGPGELYHPYRSVVALFVYRALFGLPYTVYRNYHRVFMYIDDFIPTLANAVHRFVPGLTVNIGGTEYRSVEELHKIVSRCVGVPVERDTVSFMSRDGHNTVNKHPNIEMAVKVLGHAPKVKLEDGVKRTVEWMRSVYGDVPHRVAV